MDRPKPTNSVAFNTPGLDVPDLWWQLLLVLGGVLMTLLGLFVLGGALGESPDIHWFAGVSLVIGFIGLTLPTAELWHSRHRPGPSQQDAPSGRPSRAYPFARSVLGVHLGVALGFGVCGIGWGSTLVSQGDWLRGTPVVAVGLWQLSYLVPWLLGRVRAGGVYLTATGIEFRRGSIWWQVPWSDVRFAWTTDSLDLGLKDGAGDRLEKGRTTGWGWGYGFQHLEDLLVFDCRFLAVRPAELADTIAACVADPAVRASIGDPYRTW